MRKWLENKENDFGIEKMLDDDGKEVEMLIFKNAQGFTSMVPLEWFTLRFGPEAPTGVDSLKAKDPDNETGWHAHFDSWADRF